VFDPREEFGEDEAAAAARAGVEVVGRARSVRGALSLLGRLRPDMLLTAGGIPTSRESWSFFGRAAGVDADLRSLVLVGNGDGDGAAELERALRAAAVARHERLNGGEARPLLTPREREILSLAAPGRSNAAIARLLWVTPDTVKFHLANAYRKLGVHGKADAVEVAQELELI
jgi:DNA-binding CsgD family transcriptional regulator